MRPSQRKPLLALAEPEHPSPSAPVTHSGAMPCTGLSISGNGEGAGNAATICLGSVNSSTSSEGERSPARVPCLPCSFGALAPVCSEATTYAGAHSSLFSQTLEVRPRGPPRGSAPRKHTEVGNQCEGMSTPVSARPRGWVDLAASVQRQALTVEDCGSPVGEDGTDDTAAECGLCSPIDKRLVVCSTAVACDSSAMEHNGHAALCGLSWETSHSSNDACLTDPERTLRSQSEDACPQPLAPQSRNDSVGELDVLFRLTEEVVPSPSSFARAAALHPAGAFRRRPPDAAFFVICRETQRPCTSVYSASLFGSSALRKYPRHAISSPAFDWTLLCRCTPTGSRSLRSAA